MNATPTIRSSQPPRVVRDLADLNSVVERLFDATDAACVMEICELMLGHLGVRGRLCWRHREDTDPAEYWLDLAQDPLSTRSLSVELTDPALSAPARESLEWIGRLADIRLAQLAETSRLYEAISRLALAERLQRALYAIADQASAEHDMPQMMRSLHAIVSSLMYAENFYIVLYEAATATIRFPYYVDIVDTDVPTPNQPLPLQDWLHSLTWNLLQGGQPMMGSIDELRQLLGDRFVLFGPSCEHWLGVPMLREGQV
ncbi:MAG: bifunctional diguanylate cyclase/phosphodiesterase, partial [Rhodanobacter sp.]